MKNTLQICRFKPQIGGVKINQDFAIEQGLGFVRNLAKNPLQSRWIDDSAGNDDEVISSLG